MMSSGPFLSSEQALDDYFTALLDEEAIELELKAEEQKELSLAEPELALSTSVQSVPEKSYYHAEVVEFELPNLDDVQRLLSQLESSNPVAELELEEIMEQNTVQIALKTQPVAEIVEEIQEWDIPADTLETEPEVEILTAADTVEEFAVDVEVVEQPTAEVELETQAGYSGIGTWQSTARTRDFQVLYFEVNGVTFAVPLDELGGIHRMATLNHLIGRPAWYLGLQTNKDNQLDVVDTAKWVMAEKLHDDSYKEGYQYIVMLGDSMWGLASTQLMGTELLSSEKVRWREQAGKRPWLAGMVKEKMCALIHVEALIAMLNAGLDVKALEK
ncbi:MULTISPECIES: chemotaxis protein CheW [Vibrio]|uniref:Chemotaxis protein CheW n=2 Tax=Vibrio TaxID=662 RepID=A0A289GDJ1_VIBAN|nr:chemotaxis protein CheW [Vibrio anguillarum]NAX17752.1 chemotaxis protein CheW [Vibrio sp. V22_P2S10T140]NAX42480.1 chemotaxis protein CheW [Vibrio sp. V25_P4S6T154]NNN94821.1 chemotaxis protein CheW [Vibrio sp. B4-6]OXX40874.1 chemotaxis protein CheW [Vibrio sp. V07_P2A8T137]OXX42631.1 chemotaxis protein CheW [Vibrio sp. V17_P4S1T151]OXX54759.1 chemotaxis protein CheW [Vibrio sp. V12_P9A6T4]OXX59923.1 chemotaxis protein CheW [Vibrio sp. V15_P4S5T153]OXX65995.1 chemotaxis protein CheW [V